MNSFYYPYSKTAYWSGSRRRVEKKSQSLTATTISLVTN